MLGRSLCHCILLLAMLVLASCGGGGGGSGSDGDNNEENNIAFFNSFIPTDIPAYLIGGQASNLHGQLTLSLNSDQNLTIDSDGLFNFDERLSEGSNYTVIITQQPDQQLCEIEHGEGTLNGRDVSNLKISCHDNGPSAPYVTLLVGSSVDSLFLTWSPSEDDTTLADQMSYDIHLSTEAGFEPGPSTLTSTLVGAHETTLTGLSADTLYYAGIVATNQSGISSLQFHPASTRTPARPLVFNPSVPLENAADLNLGEPTIEGNTYTYTSTGSSTLPTAGAILIGENANSGYMRKVVSATTEGDTIVVETTDAALSEAITEGAINSRMTLNNLDEALTSEIESSTQSNTRALSLSNNTTTKFDSLISFAPDFDVHLDWSGTTINSGKVMVKGLLNIQTDSLFSYLDSLSLEENIPFPLLNRNYVVQYDVDSLEVIQEVGFKVNAMITIAAEREIKAEVHTNELRWLDFGFTYDNQRREWVFHPSDTTGVGTVVASLPLGSNLTAELRLIPSFFIRFNGEALTNISLESYVESFIKERPIHEFGIITRVTPRSALLTDFDVHLGLECHADLSLDLLLSEHQFFTAQLCDSKRKRFSLPKLTLEQTETASGYELTAIVTDGINNPFNPTSVKWEIASGEKVDIIVDPFNPMRARINKKLNETTVIIFSGYGTLGEEARQFADITIDVNEVRVYYDDAKERLQTVETYYMLDDVLHTKRETYSEFGPLARKSFKIGYLDNYTYLEETTYYLSGALQSIERGSSESSLLTGYYESGARASETPIIEGVREGISRGYYESGSLQSTTPYVNGIPQGMEKWFYESGAIMEERPLVKGTRDGIVQGLLDGIWKDYYESGALRTWDQYVNGTPVRGARKSYYESGPIMNEIIVLSERSHLSKMYFESGSLMSEQTYVNDKPYGTAKYYYENGDLQGELPYVDGFAEGVSKMYYEGGAIKSETPYVKGLIQGMQKEYYESGVLKKETPHVNNLPHGESHSYTENKCLNSTITYDKGNRTDEIRFECP